MLLNYYTSHKTARVAKQITPENWLELIKESGWKANILEGAQYKLTNRDLYNDYKASVPVITPNFYYNNYKSDLNIISATGLLYIDVDFNKNIETQFDPSTLNKNLIYAYFKSFSGLGYGILVKVSGLTKENYLETCLDIVKKLGISNYVDSGAMKASQYLALSYDPNLFHNSHSYQFTAIDSDCVPPSEKNKKEKTYTTEGGTDHNVNEKTDDGTFDIINTKLRFDNLLEVVGQFDEEYHVNWQGYEFVKVWLPFKTKIKVGNRYNSFLSITTNLVWLNPDESFQRILNILKNFNQEYCEEPMCLKQIHKILTSIFKMKGDGNLKSNKFWKKRKIIFNKHCYLTKDEKLAIVRDEVASKKASDSRVKLFTILSNWNFYEHGKITHRSIVKNYPISKKTVQKYLKDFNIHNELNHSFEQLQKALNAEKVVKLKCERTLLTNDDILEAC